MPLAVFSYIFRLVYGYSGGNRSPNSVSRRKIPRCYLLTQEIISKPPPSETLPQSIHKNICCSFLCFLYTPFYGSCKVCFAELHFKLIKAKPGFVFRCEYAEYSRSASAHKRSLSTAALHGLFDIRAFRYLYHLLENIVHFSYISAVSRFSLHTAWRCGLHDVYAAPRLSVCMHSR